MEPSPATHRWPVELRAGAVVLRPLRRGDARRWREVRERNRGWTGPWDATVPPTSERGAPSFGQMVRALSAQAREGSSLPFALCWDEQLASGGKPTAPRRLPVSGQVTVSGITYGSARFAHCGYWIDEALAGRGIMPVAVALAVDHCFTAMRLHRVEINIRPENTPSLRVVEKLGLREEGYKPRYLHIDGDWRDHRCFAVDTDELRDADGRPVTLLSRLLDGAPAPGEPGWSRAK
ncbi:GNAT family protein [Luteococcus peritonei]|uniref:GNAT family protein n=1 Tax=Luteococcus peritonei TaxID=88874 RepID=A0ABW4RZ66_9ACTN